MDDRGCASPDAISDASVTSSALHGFPLRIPSAFLALTSFLMYCRITITLLDQYGIFKLPSMIRLYDVPVVDYALEFLVLLFMIVTIGTFIRDEKRVHGN